MADELDVEEPEILTFDVYSVDDDTEDETLIGRVEYGPEGRLGLLDVEPAQAERLASVVDGVNRKESLVEITSAGPDSPRYGTTSRAVKRTDKEFLQALQKHLRQYYGLTLG